MTRRFVFCHSHGGAGHEEGLALRAALPQLREGDEDPGVQPAAGVLPLAHLGLHGRGLRRQHGVHRPVSDFPPRSHGAADDLAGTLSGSEGAEGTKCR